MIVTGAAPASPTVLGFLRAALGCQVSRGCPWGDGELGWDLRTASICRDSRVCGHNSPVSLRQRGSRGQPVASGRQALLSLRAAASTKHQVIPPVPAFG